jgi:membrane protease YdiL (CAAX protease family)
MATPEGEKELGIQQTAESHIHRAPLTVFFVLAYAISWAFILPWSVSESAVGLGFLPYTLPDAYGIVMFVFAPLGPALAAVVVTAVIEGRTGVRRLLGRIKRWRVGLRWYVVALFGFMFAYVAGYVAVLGASPITALLENWPLFFTTFLPLLVLGIFVPAIGEEPGWRGFALPRLQERYGPVWGTLVLGTLVGLYHTPAFFTPFLGPITLPGFLAFELTAIAATFIYTWVFNGSGGSLLIVILLHAAGNAASGLLTGVFADLPYGGWAATIIDGGVLNVIVFSSIAVILVVLTRGRLSHGAVEQRGT